MIRSRARSTIFFPATGNGYRNTTHWHRVLRVLIPTGEGDVKSSGNDNSILKEYFIEITYLEEQKAI
jgi:hypothetical protein